MRARFQLARPQRAWRGVLSPSLATMTGAEDRFTSHFAVAINHVRSVRHIWRFKAVTPPA